MFFVIVFPGFWLFFASSVFHCSFRLVVLSMYFVIFVLGFGFGFVSLWGFGCFYVRGGDLIFRVFCSCTLLSENYL